MAARRRNRVRELREAKGWSQEGLAWKSRLSKQTIVSLENGRDARASTLRAVSKALGVTIDEMLQPPEKVEKAAV